MTLQTINFVVAMALMVSGVVSLVGSLASVFMCMVDLSYLTLEETKFVEKSSKWPNYNARGI